MTGAGSTGPGPAEPGAGEPGPAYRQWPDPGVTVREAVAGDVERLVALIALGALAPAEPPVDLSPYVAALDEIARTPGCSVLVAERSGEVVGMCQLIVFRHFQQSGGRCAEVESVHVHPDHRSQGIGGVLLEAAVDRAVAAGCYRVQLTSNKARTAAHRFYERHRFVPSHEGYKRLLP